MAPFEGSPAHYAPVVAPTKPDVFSLQGLIAWLETQDPETEYCYFRNGDCLLHRYLRNNGVQMPESHGVGGNFYYPKDGSRNPLPFGFATVAVRTPHTYGAALTRARAALVAS